VRVCERMGSFVGIYDPYDYTARLPIEVTAVKLTQLFAIQRHELIDVVEAVGDTEASILLRALSNEQKTVLDALKFGRVSKKPVEPTPEEIAAEEDADDIAARQRMTKRRSKADAAVGNLLTNAGAGTGHGVGATSGEAVTATLHLWDDAVDAVKGSTQQLEETTKAYRKEVFGFVKGMSQAEQLLAALQLIPEAERPKAQPDCQVPPVQLQLKPSQQLPKPGHPPLKLPQVADCRAHGVAMPAAPGTTQGAGGSFGVPGCNGITGHSGDTAAGLNSSTEAEPPLDSSSRLFTNMLSGFGFKPQSDRSNSEAHPMSATVGGASVGAASARAGTLPVGKASAQAASKWEDDISAGNLTA